MIDHFLPTDRYASEEDRYRAEQAAQSVARIKFYRIQNMNKAEWERVEDKKKNRTLSRAATSSRPHSAAPSLFQPPSRVASSASNASTDIFASLSTTSTALPSRGSLGRPVGSYLGTLDGIRCRAGYSNHMTSGSLQLPKIAVRAHIGSHTVSRPTPPESTTSGESTCTDPGRIREPLRLPSRDSLHAIRPHSTFHVHG